MPKLSPIAHLLAVTLIGGARLAAAAEAPAAGPVTLANHVKPVLEQYCFDCHNKDKQKGDMNLVDLAQNSNLQANRAAWAKVIEAMENGDMPPEKKPHPSDQQRDLVLHFLDGEISKMDCTAAKNPGRVTLRRLNREEYRNTVRELLAVNFDSDAFPNDEVGYGFDNIGDVLSLSPMLMEKYLAAAEEIAGKAIQTGPAEAPVRHIRGKEFQPQSNAVRADDDGSFVFVGNGEGIKAFEFPQKGVYTFRIRAYGDQAGPDPCKLSVRLDGKEFHLFDVKATPGHAEVYECTVDAERGWKKIGIAFTNDYYDDKSADPKLRGDRNLYVESVDLKLPPGLASMPEAHRRLITKIPAAGQEKATARELLKPFLGRAYRRPATDGEVERIAKFVDLALDHHATFEEGMQVAVQATLCSPEFLFRWELDPPKAQPGEVRTLNDFEVASRLAYFLWSSMPDDELFAIAQKGELLKNGNLEKQISRMLKDWRGRALTRNFADQWLQTRNIFEIIPDTKAFPNWTDDLRGIMREESERFFEAIIKEDRNVLDLLDADFTYLNEKLANYYGIPGVKGAEFQRVTLPAGSPRGGVLTMGAVLMTTSTPTRTSPVIRGKWILEQILGTPPPAPPAAVPPLNEQATINQSASLRQRLGEHSSRVECAGCHKRMDPLGFALENFNAVGEWRDKDGKFPIDASGKLPDGHQFNGPKELKAILKTGDGFLASFSEKLLTYALGRGLDYNDRCSIKSIVEQTKAHENKFSALVASIVTSEPFMKRKTADALTKN